MFSKLFLMRSNVNKPLGILPPFTPPEDWGGIRIVLFLILASASFAQPFPPDSVWTFAFDDGGDEYFYDAIEVSDGYLLCGEAREWNAMAGEALLVKIDRDGELVWSRRYADNEYWRFKQIDSSQNGYYLATEITASSGQRSRIAVYELNSHGDLGAQLEIDGGDSANASLGSAFYMNSNEWRVSYTLSSSANGRHLSYKRRSGAGTETSYFDGIRINENSGHLLMGPDFVLFGSVRDSVNSNSNGVLRSSGQNSEFGGPENDAIFGATIDISSNQLVSTGFTELDGVTSDLWLFSAVMYDIDSLLWNKHYGGLAYEDGVEIVNASDGGFIIAGNFSSEDIEFEQSDYWLLKVDENGDSVWSVVKGGDEADRCDGMIQTENGFLLFGASQSFAVPGWDGCAMFLAYVPDIAALPASLNFGPVAVGDSSSHSLGLINTGSNVLTVTEISSTANYHANFTGPATVEIGDTLNVPVVFTPQSVGTHVDTLRILSDAVSGVKNVRCLGAGTAADADDGSLLPKEFKLYPPYPNPFNPTTVIRFELPKAQFVKLELLDVTGRLVQKIVDQSFAAGEHQIMIDGARLASGIYFAAIKAGENYAVQKLLLVK